jgi:hypothetical protein
MGATDRPIGCALTLLEDAHIAPMMQGVALKFRHGRTCSDHRRLVAAPKTWMPATGAGVAFNQNLIGP